MMSGLVSLTLLPALCVAIGEESLEKRLYTDLFANYSSRLRPITGDNYNQTIEVAVEFGLSSIESLNEKEQRLTSHGFMSLTWTDQLLHWRPEDYGDAHFIIVPSEDVWIPEITATNSVSDADELAFQEEDSRVRILYTGQITWIPLMKWSTSCHVDVTNFPYDVQECIIEYANWMYTSRLVKFITPPHQVSQIEDSGLEWTVVSADAFTDEISQGNLTYPLVRLRVQIRRNPLYFELNVLLPAVLLSFLQIPMFTLPVESGEKVSLGITLMLSYSIFLLMMTDYTPQSGTTPELSLAIMVCLVFSGVGMFSNIMIINLHHHLPERPVPGWVKVCVLGHLGRFLCGMNYNNRKNINQVQPDEIPEEKKQRPALLPDGLTHSDIARILEHLERMRTKQLDEDQTEQNRQDWNKLARVLDRLMLVVFTICFIIYLCVVLVLKYSH